MPIDKLEFEKRWTNPAHFPTYEPDEAQVRADMQYHPDAIAKHLNEVVAPAVDADTEICERAEEHMGDDDIHVTAADKASWNGKVCPSDTAPTDTDCLWIDLSDGGVAKYWNGTEWAAIAAKTTQRVAAADLFTQDPENPVLGQFWVVDGAAPELRIQLHNGVGSIALSLL